MPRSILARTVTCTLAWIVSACPRFRCRNSGPFTPPDRADADRLHDRGNRARARAADAGVLPRQSHPRRARARTFGAHDADNIRQHATDGVDIPAHS